MKISSFIRTICLVIVLLCVNDLQALTKPVDVKDYNLTYQGVGSGSLTYSGGTLYRDNQDGGSSCGCGEGEGRGGHPAVDIPCLVNTPVRSIASGMVVEAHSDSRGFGNTVVIRHDSNDISTLQMPQNVIYSCYSHLNSYSVNQGDSVTEGQVIAMSGNSGPSTYHLHFQIDRYKRLDNGEVITTSNTNISSNTHPYLPYPYIVNEQDVNHDRENYTINPMPFLQMNEYDPCYIPVGFVLNADYSGYPHWTTDGRSQAFRDRYDLFFTSHNTALGFPWDNVPDWLPYGQVVHRIDEAGGMWIQDLYGPHNGLSHPHSALIQGNSPTDPVYILKEGFWDYWIHNVGWESFGKPVNDEYLTNGVPHQTFRKPDRAYVFSWVNGSVQVDSLFGPVAVMRNVDFVSFAAARTAGDGIYHSGLFATEFNNSIELINGVTYDGFVSVIGGVEQSIGAFTVNGDMTINLDQVNSQVIDLTVVPSVPLPGQSFQVFTLITESPGVIVDGFRIVLQTISGSVLNTIYSANNLNLSTGVDLVSTAQYPTAGIYKIGVQYSLDNGSTWTYFDHDNTTYNPLIFDILSPPVASFSRTPSSGTAPLNVQFTNQSTGNPTSWNWNFGDGQTSTAQNPNHTYATAGNYNVTLLVQNSAGSNSYFWSNCVAVDESSSQPVVNFAADVTSGDAPLTVHFTDLSTGNPTDWEWNFTDGGMSTEQNPTHVYQYPGVYGVYLSISNAYGADAMWRFDYIQVNGEALESNFTADVVSGQVPLIVQFTDQSTGSPILWSWNFGDGVHSTEQNPSHVYDAPGIYNVSLWVEDGVSGDGLTRPQYITVTDEGGCLGDGGYGFDGQSSYLSFSPYNPGTGDFTIEGWVKADELPLNTASIIFYEEQSGATGRPGIKCNVNQERRLAFTTAEAGHGGQYDQDLQSISMIEEDVWTYIAYSREDGLYKVYINGQLDNAIDYGANNPVSGVNSPAYFGHRYNSTYPAAQYYFDGQVDEWRISNVARTAEEISTHYYDREEFAVDAQTIALWHMNGSLGTVGKRENTQGNSTMELIEQNGPTVAYGFDECFSLDQPQLNIIYFGNELFLDWNDISGANSYQVYGANENGDYILLASPTFSEQTFSSANFDSGNVWIFYVTALR